MVPMCLAFRTLTKYVVQSRPITTLYPIPEANDEEKSCFMCLWNINK